MLVRIALALAWGRLVRLPRRLFAPPAEVRRDPELRLPPDLGTPYYAAYGSRGYELIPKDAYLEAVEGILAEISHPE